MDNFNKLLETLNNEMLLYEKLYELLIKEADYITELDRNGLSINNAKKEPLLSRLLRLNEKRKFYIGQISKDLGSPEIMTLRQLVNMVPEEMRTEYKTCHDKFMELVRKVRDRNIYNSEYLQLSLKRLRAITGNLLRYMNQGATYNQKGKMPDKQGPSSFMAKEA